MGGQGGSYRRGARGDRDSHLARAGSGRRTRCGGRCGGPLGRRPAAHEGGHADRDSWARPRVTAEVLRPPLSLAPPQSSLARPGTRSRHLRAPPASCERAYLPRDYWHLTPASISPNSAEAGPAHATGSVVANSKAPEPAASQWELSPTRSRLRRADRTPRGPGASRAGLRRSLYTTSLTDWAGGAQGGGKERSGRNLGRGEIRVETWREISPNCSLPGLGRKKVLHVLGVVQGPETRKLKTRRQLGGGAEVSSPVRWMCLFKYTNWSLEENKRHYCNKCKTGLISVFSEVDLSILTRSLMPWIKAVMSSIFSNPCIPTSAYFPLRYLSSYKFPQTCLPSVAVRAEEVGLALWIMKFLIFKPCWF